MALYMQGRALMVPTIEVPHVLLGVMVACHAQAAVLFEMVVTRMVPRHRWTFQNQEPLLCMASLRCRS